MCVFLGGGVFAVHSFSIASRLCAKMKTKYKVGLYSFFERFLRVVNLHFCLFSERKKKGTSEVLNIENNVVQH